MERTKDASDPQLAIGVVLQDATGQYYAIPQAELLRFRMPERQGALFEAILDGADAVDVAVSADDPLRGESDLDPTPGLGSAASVWRFRTSRRSDRLWLLLA